MEATYPLETSAEFNELHDVSQKTMFVTTAMTTAYPAKGQGRCELSSVRSDMSALPTIHGVRGSNLGRTATIRRYLSTTARYFEVGHGRVRSLLYNAHQLNDSAFLAI
jgi:hypothetical protein